MKTAYVVVELLFSLKLTFDHALFSVFASQSWSAVSSTMTARISWISATPFDFLPILLPQRRENVYRCPHVFVELCFRRCYSVAILRYTVDEKFNDFCAWSRPCMQRSLSKLASRCPSQRSLCPSDFVAIGVSICGIDARKNIIPRE